MQKDSEELEGEIKDLVREYFRKKGGEETDKTPVPLAIPNYDHKEVNEALDALLSAWVTMGEKVEEFEENVADYIGTKHAIMTNSGSSALLLALETLANPQVDNGFGRGSKVIVPAIAWSTTVFSVLSAEAKPVLVDVGLNDYNLDVSEVEKMVNSGDISGLLPIHLMGDPCDMESLASIAEENNLFQVEDGCEALGAEVDGQKVGSFGDLSAFSFFFSHQISTIEGGMTLTDNDEYANIARTLRAHGWIRDRTDKDRIKKEHPEIDGRFLFANKGYNLRPTEIQAAFGIHQLDRLDGIIDRRNENAMKLNKELKTFSESLILPREKNNTRHAWFGYPLCLKKGSSVDRGGLMDHLETNGIETRQLAAGNMRDQPAMELFDYGSGELSNSNHIMRNAFFIGNHTGVGEEEIDHISRCFREFFSEEGKDGKSADHG